MKLNKSILTFLLASCCLCFGGDGHDEKKQEKIEDIGSSDVVQFQPMAPEEVFQGNSEGRASSVTSLRKSDGSSVILNPEAKVETADAHWRDELTNELLLGINVAGEDGLLKITRTSKDGIVEELVLPNGSIRSSPKTLLGRPIKKSELIKLSSGKRNKIVLLDGTPLSVAQTPVPYSSTNPY